MTRLPDDRYLELHADDDVRIAGTRVGIEQILEGYLVGATAEQLAVEFPSVSLEQVHGVLAYYLRNRELVDEYLGDYYSASQARQRQRGAAADVVQRLRRLANERAAR